jgi:porphobilinogen deaminase
VVAIRSGTRKSVMALAQTEEVARRLTAVAPDVDVEIVKFETTGESDQTSKLLQHGGKGRLFREISTKLTQLGTPYRRSGDCDFRFCEGFRMTAHRDD